MSSHAALRGGRYNIPGMWQRGPVGKGGGLHYPQNVGSNPTVANTTQSSPEGALQRLPPGIALCMGKSKSYRSIVDRYVDDVLTGKEKRAGAEVVAACKRYKDDLQREDLELRTKDPDIAINIIQQTMVHAQGEDLDGQPLLGRPFLLEPFQVFMVYNLLGFYYTGTNNRRFKEAFVELGRKNGKTSLIAGLAWAVAILQRRSGSKVYIVGAALKQAKQAFSFILFSLRYQGLIDKFEVRDNSFDHTIGYTFLDADDRPDGSIEIIALAANPDKQDSFNCNFAICDEVAAYKKPAQYNRFKEAMKAYQNKLIVGITTAGDNVNSFGYARQEYAVKVATGVVKDDSFFAFVARADQDEAGDVDYTSPEQHMKANPNYGVTIRPEDILQESLQAQNDPIQRKDFLSRSLNIYTTSMRSWFDLDEFKASDRRYNWTLEELARLPIVWYGGADLSRMYDLTATALFGHYDKEDVDIVITHGFFPVTQAARKADEDNIPLFGWKDDGWLTICNTPTVNVSDAVHWFIDMRKMGFKIQEVGFDRKFSGEEYLPQMTNAGFKLREQPQMYFIKSKGFRRIEKSAKDGRLYYLHSEAYEYCVSNVHAVEKTDDMISYEKISPTARMDLFDASVFSCVRWIEAHTKAERIRKWWG